MGIYGVGELVKAQQMNIAVIILFKDKSAQVAERLDLMTLRRIIEEFARFLVLIMKWIFASQLNFRS